MDNNIDLENLKKVSEAMLRLQLCFNKMNKSVDTFKREFIRIANELENNKEKSNGSIRR